MSGEHPHEHSHDPATAAPERVRLRPMMALLKSHRRALSLAVAAGIASHLLLIASAVLGAVMVGRALDGQSGSQLTGPFTALLALVVPLAIAPVLETHVAHVVAFRVLVDVRGRVFVDVRGRVFDAFARMSPGDLLHKRAGALGSSAVSDVEMLEVFFAHTLSPLVSAAVVPVACVVVLAFFDPWLAVALVPVLVMLGSVPVWLRKRSRADGDAVRSSLADLNGEVVDGVQGLREVLLAGAVDSELDGLRERGRRLDRAKRRHSSRAGIEVAATDVLVTLGLLAGLLVGGTLVASGALRPETFPSVVVLAALSLAPVTAVVDVAREVGIVAAAAARLQELLATEQALPEPQAPVPARTGSVRFEGVGFRYRDDLPFAVRDVSFEIAPGETVALVGHSGAGKSTCAHLLLRLWDVTEGRITVGGVDVRSLADDELRPLVSYVPQDVHLFNLSIAENLRVGAPEASDDALTRAAGDALAHGFVSELPDRYATSIGEHGNLLSGGQRQRLAIARALLVDSPVVVLDEAVSNLDTQSEAEVAAGLARAHAGRTCLVIAHRLSTIQAADRVVVLEDGAVVETGTPAELLHVGGPFSRLVAAQRQPA